jgi:hypothetical protein
MFTIKSVFRVDAETVRVLVAVDAKHWNTCKAKGHLAQLYCVDISNAIYRGYQVQAYKPSVGQGECRASNGVKALTLDYADSVWVPAPDNVVRVDFKARKRVA